MAQDRLHPGLKRRRQRGSTLGVIQIPDIAQVPQVEWDVVFVLSDQNNFTAECVGDARLVEDVWVSPVQSQTTMRERSIRATTS